MLRATLHLAHFFVANSASLGELYNKKHYQNAILYSLEMMVYLSFWKICSFEAAPKQFAAEM
jgi:hypothetical protein